MPSYVVLPPGTLSGATRYEAESPQEALKLVPADVGLPTRVSVVDLSAVTDLIVVEPGESQTPVIVRGRQPRVPEGVNAFRATPESTVVTWNEVPAAESYVVYADDKQVAEVPVGRYQFSTPEASVGLAVAAVASGVEGQKSEKVTVHGKQAA